MHCGGKLARVILIGVNIVFLVVGLVFLIVGIVMRVDNSTLFTEEVRSTLNGVDLAGSLSLGTLVNALNIIFICIGVFTILMAVLCLLGVFCKIRLMLIIYAIVIIVILVLQLVCVALWFFMREEVESTLEEELYNVLLDYDGVLSGDETSNGWDLIFIEYECCGTVSIAPGQNDNHFQNTKYWSNPNRPASDKVPTSCCKDATKGNYKSHTNTACTVDLTDNWQVSCYEKLKEELIEKYQTGAIILAVILLVVEIVGIIFSIILYRALGKDDVMV